MDVTLWTFAAGVLGFNLVRGIDEGMIMTPTMKQHPYYRYYHRLRFLEVMLTILWGMNLYQVQYDLLSLQGVAFVAGIIVLSWELFEIGYAHSRFDTYLPPGENVMGAGIYLQGNELVALHAGRVAVSITLIIIGLI